MAGAGANGGHAGHGTRPLHAGKPLADDLADVLPPVRYQPGRGTVPAPGNGSPVNGRPASGRLAADLDGAGRPASPARSHRLLVVASMVAAASISVVLPVLGTLSSLALIVGLRATGLAQRRRAQRLLARGSRRTDPLLATMSFPWFLLRALLALLLLSPFALAVAAVAAAVTVAFAPSDWPARAIAVGAGAMVAFYGLGPGSRTARNQLKRVFGAVATTRSAQAVAVTGMVALAIAALAAAISWPSLYWPALTGGLGHLHLGHLHRSGLLLHFGLAHHITLLRLAVIHRLGLLGRIT
jgi:hypothetical protein